MTRKSPHKTKEFLELQKSWYGKLKKSGFDDIEQDEDHLKKWHTHYFERNYSAEAFKAKESYYIAAGRFLHYFEFKTPLDKSIWKMHSEGHTFNEITESLSKTGNPIPNTAVFKIVKNLSKFMLVWRHYDHE